jgi:hypothetical protein
MKRREGSTSNPLRPLAVRRVSKHASGWLRRERAEWQQRSSSPLCKPAFASHCSRCSLGLLSSSCRRRRFVSDGRFGQNSTGPSWPWQGALPGLLAWSSSVGKTNAHARPEEAIGRLGRQPCPAGLPTKFPMNSKADPVWTGGSCIWSGIYCWSVLELLSILTEHSSG